MAIRSKLRGSTPELGTEGAQPIISEWKQPSILSQPSAVHASPSSQSRGDVAWQLPAPSQKSDSVQRFESLHEVPEGALLVVQPMAGLQLSVVQSLVSLQTIGSPMQLPAPLQESDWVQRLESLHEVPEGALLVVQPVAGLQLSVVQSLVSLQTIGSPMQLPAPLQESDWVQRLESLHEVPAGVLVAVQPVAGLQLSMVQLLVSSQNTGAPWVQLPAPSQVSPFVHALLSLQLRPKTSNWQLAEQQLPLAVVPLSQSSPASTVPSPQTPLPLLLASIDPLAPAKLRGELVLSVPF
jgi:hypothetical protein